MDEMIEVRTHHLLCIPRFYSGGYNKKFADNMKNVCWTIRENPNTKIKLLVAKPDALCKKCPHWGGDKCIQSPEITKMVVAKDKEVIKYLKLKPNSIHKAKDLFNLSMEKVNDKNMRKVCKGCIFLEDCAHVGINKTFKKKLNKE